MTDRYARLTPAAIAGVAVALSVTTIAVAVVDSRGGAALFDSNEANSLLAGLVFGLVGALLVRDAPANRLGPLMSAGGLLAAASALGYEIARNPDRALASAGSWAASALWLPAFLGLTVALPLLFPDGHLASARWRWPARIGLTATAVGIGALVTTQQVFDDDTLAHVDNPLDLPLPDGPQMVVAGVAVVVAVLVGVAAAVAVLVRARKVGPEQRGRYAWFAAAILLGLLSTAPLPGVASFVVDLASFTALAVGVARHQLFEIEPLFSRTLVYVVLSGVVLSVYLVSTTAIGAQTRTGVVPAVLASVAAVLLARVQGGLHRAVRRLLYGERDDPSRALDELGDRLAAALNPDEVLPAAVATVRRTLRLPYAAIALAGEDDAACTEGDRPARTADLILEHAGEAVGTLTVGLRPGERELSERDRVVLTRFARQVAVAAHGVRTTRALRRSREQVLVTRERERSRIHRDLHDGLGPALAGITLGLETATRAATRDGPAAAALLRELHDDTAACVDDVRRIVADLRPVTLDDAGLLGALRRQGELLSASTGGVLRVEFYDSATELDGSPVGGGQRTSPLPSAVELAAYRIATEAMTNAARHARATTVRVVLRRADGLVVRIEDDGCGAPPAHLGTGLTSMRERAEELGGRLSVDFRPGTGSTVTATLPLRITP